jgi:hypothetical protein
MVFENTEQFVKKFKLNERPDYFECVELRDRKVGFSIKRLYPDDISYKPTRTSDGSPNNTAALWVTYLHPSETSKKLDHNRIPITIRISNIDLYVAKHWDYDFDDPRSPTEESVEKSKKTRKPIELESNEEFYYDHAHDRFIDKKGTVFTGLQILDKIYIEHCNTVHFFKGLAIRSKLFMRSKIHTSLGLIIGFIKFILLKVFGRTIEDEDGLSELFRGYDAHSLKKLSTDSLEVFGYKAPKGIIILYCLLVVTYSVFALKIENSYLHLIADKEILILAHSIFVLWFLDFVVPPILFHIMNVVIWLRTKIMRMKFKV